MYICRERERLSIVYVAVVDLVQQRRGRAGEPI